MSISDLQCHQHVTSANIFSTLNVNDVLYTRVCDKIFRIYKIYNI